MLALGKDGIYVSNLSPTFSESIIESKILRMRSMHTVYVFLWAVSPIWNFIWPPSFIQEENLQLDMSFSVEERGNPNTGNYRLFFSKQKLRKRD